jgi:ABC-2 type transport system permease protein
MNGFKYYHISKINFKNNFAYFKDSIASALFVSVIIFIFSNIWRVVFNATQTELINGFTYPMMIWYLVLTESIIISQGRIIIEIGKEVISGEIANYLNKPYNYIFYKYASTIGASISNFLLTFIIAGLTATLLVGPISINPLNLPLILTSCLIGITLHFSMMTTLGIFTLWMEDSRSLDFLYQKIIFVAGGMLAPLDIFPTWFTNIALILPFSYAVYAPAMLFVNFSIGKFIEISLIQTFWILITISVALVLFKFLSRRVSINGG